MSKTSLREHKTDRDFGPLFSGELLRDEALETISAHNFPWMELCIETIDRRFYIGPTFTGEDIRFELSRRVGCPAHPNAWGALVATLIKRKIIRPTGEYRAMKDDTSHARKTPVYTK